MLFNADYQINLSRRMPFEDLSRALQTDSSITACLYEDVNILRGITFRHTYILSHIMSDFLIISLKAFFFFFFFLSFSRPS